MFITETEVKLKLFMYNFIITESITKRLTEIK